MKTYVRKDDPKFIIKKRVLFNNCFLFIAVLLLLVSGCIEDVDPGVRLVLPELTTDVPSGITATSATSGGNISSDGGYAVTARGVCWSFEINPSISQAPDSITVDGTGSGQFTSTIDGLLPSTTYHIRAYATNTQGTSYGQDVSFTTAEE